VEQNEHLLLVEDNKEVDSIMSISYGVLFLDPLLVNRNVFVGTELGMLQTG
jgi:hypothetical protein